MKDRIYVYVLCLAVAVLLVFALAGCSTLKTVGTTALEVVEDVALPMAGGAGGALVAGPIGAAVGAGALAVADRKINENADLKSGALIGKKALDLETERRIREANAEAERRIAEAAGEIGRLKTTLDDRPEVSKGTWTKVLWALVIGAAMFLWIKGHHFLRLMNGGGLSALACMFLPSWLQRKLGLGPKISAKPPTET